uniref:Myosin tail domain-containing protein n=1 Tax=Parascaris equorum TaxID=6256 RepID=A0A914RY38_PAREQ
MKYLVRIRGTHVVPSEVLRSVRYAIRSRDNELQQLQRKLKNTELQISELVTRFEGADEARKRLEKQLADSKREISNREKTIDEASREVRRLEDRLRATESDKTVAENARAKLEEEVRRLKLVIDQTVADGERKALEEAEAQKRVIEEEYKTRITELLHRVDTLQDDNKRLKDLTIKHLEDLRGDLLKDLESQRARFDAVTSEFDNLQANYDTTTKNTVAIEMTVKEIKQQRDEISKQKDELANQLTDMMRRMEIEIRKREDIERANLRQVAEIEKLKTEIGDYESQLTILRRHNDELDTQLKTSQAK